MNTYYTVMYNAHCLFVDEMYMSNVTGVRVVGRDYHKVIDFHIELIYFLDRMNIFITIGEITFLEYI